MNELIIKKINDENYSGSVFKDLLNVNVTNVKNETSTPILVKVKFKKGETVLRSYEELKVKSNIDLIIIRKKYEVIE